MESREEPAVETCFFLPPSGSREAASLQSQVEQLSQMVNSLMAKIMVHVVSHCGSAVSCGNTVNLEHRKRGGSFVLVAACCV